MPHLMNCPHTGDGWCLECVDELQQTAGHFETLLRNVVFAYADIHKGPPYVRSDAPGFYDAYQAACDALEAIDAS